MRKTCAKQPLVTWVALALGTIVLTAAIAITSLSGCGQVPKPLGPDDIGDDLYAMAWNEEATNLSGPGLKRYCEKYDGQEVDWVMVVVYGGRGHQGQLRDNYAARGRPDDDSSVYTIYPAGGVTEELPLWTGDYRTRIRVKGTLKCDPEDVRHGTPAQIINAEVTPFEWSPE